MTLEPVSPKALWTPLAWLPHGWQRHVLLTIGQDGCWASVETDVPTPPAEATPVAGALLPGLVNAHSHAFQRAFAGLAETTTGEQDDFWSWRSRMYHLAARITPELLRAIAAQLYLELLQGGYTQVCEFHYLHRDAAGKLYAEPLTMVEPLLQAAEDVGIGLTLLPTVYERAGFGQPDLLPEQRRFLATPDLVWNLVKSVEQCHRPGVNVGLALHSVRAVRPESFSHMRRLTEDFTGPIHIHVAEQMAEVEACLRATGARPVAWLAREGYLDPRWQLVHATHTDAAEREAIAQSGAGVVICPTTEANLGDGFVDLSAWAELGVPLAIGSDSHVSRDWREELRWLVYSTRLLTQRRGIAGLPSPATSLFAGAQLAGGDAAGLPRWGLTPGARADALVLATDAASLMGATPEHLLEAVVFSSPGPAWSDVFVAGRWWLQRGRHPRQGRIHARFKAAMETLWASVRPCSQNADHPPDDSPN
jgi:formimidoylglutamate deiminase